MIVQLMHERADKRLDEATSAHEGRIRELSQLIALRDRQLSGALARAASAPKALNKRPLTPSSAGLLVTPSLPEAKGVWRWREQERLAVRSDVYHAAAAPRWREPASDRLCAGRCAWVRLEQASAQMSARSRPGAARWSTPHTQDTRMGPTPASEVPVPLLVSSSAATLYPSPGRGGIERPGSPARPPSANVQQRSAFAQHVAHRQQQRPATCVCVLALRACPAPRPSSRSRRCPRWEVRERWSGRRRLEEPRSRRRSRRWSARGCFTAVRREMGSQSLM